MSEYEPYDPQPKSKGSQGTWVQQHFKVLVVAAVIAAILVALFAGLTGVRRIKAEGHKLENLAIAQNNNVSTALSTCLSNIQFGSDVAQQERQTYVKGMRDIIAARVANHQQAVGSPTILVTAVKEAYPQMPNDIYRDLLTVAVGCQNKVNGEQNHLQGVARDLRDWVNEGNAITGIIHDEFPTDNLYVEGPEGRLTGKAALEWMMTPIITDEAKDATKTRTMPQPRMPGSESTPK